MKRILLFIILLILLPSAFAHAEEKTKYDKLMTGLELLSEFEDGTFRQDAYVTNEEFLKSVYKLLKMEAQENVSSDVLLDLGIIRKSLNTDEALSLDDLIFAMTRLLGYKSDNYKKDASDAGLYQGAVQKDGYVTREVFSRIVYNTLLAEKMEVSNIQDGRLTLKKGITLLEDVFNVKRIVGIAEADSTAYLYEEPVIIPANGEILIDGIAVAGVGDTKEYLARQVEAFLKFEENNENQAEAVVIEKYRNTEIKATSEFIDGATTSSQLVWLDKGSERLKKEKIPSGAVVFYNGKRIGTAGGQEWSLFTPADGEVNLIDNDRDGEAEAVIVWSYIPYVIDYINSSSETIFDKSGRAPIELRDRNYVIFNSDGERIGLTDLNPADVISVTFSDSENDEIYIRAADGNTASGICVREAFSITIGKDEYSLAGYSNISKINSGDFIIAYLDIYDRVVFAEGKSDYEYGYLTKASYDYNSDEVLYLKMYTFDGEVKTFEAADTITVYKDLVKTKYQKNKSGLDNSYTAFMNIYSGRQELIKFKRNADGKVRELIFGNSKIGVEFPDTDGGFDIYYGLNGDPVRFREAKYLQNSFATLYRVTEDTKILSIEGDSSKPENFVRISMSDLVADNDYNVIIYDVNERFEAGAVIIEKVEDWYSKFGSIVAGVSYVTGDGGEELLELSVYTLGELKTITADNFDIVSNETVARNFQNSGIRLSEIGVGDVIYYNLDKNGMIASFAVLHKNKPEQGFYWRSNYGWGGNYIPNAAMAVTYCEVRKTFRDLIVADIDGPRPIGEYTWRNYYIYEKGRNRIFKAEFSDVKPGDKIVGLWKWSNMNDLIIYR